MLSETIPTEKYNNNDLPGWFISILLAKFNNGQKSPSRRHYNLLIYLQMLKSTKARHILFTL